MSELDRLAVIEVGTRGIRLLVVERRDPPEGMAVLQSRGELGNLGEGLDQNDGRMQAENIQDNLDRVRRFLRMAQALAADRILLVGTHVFRCARNVDEFCDRLPEPLSLFVLAPEQEAVGSFLAACWGLRKESPTRGPLVVIDLGGGSLEVVAGLQGDPPRPIASVSLGSLGILAVREAWTHVAESMDPENGLRRYLDAELGRSAGSFAALRPVAAEKPDASSLLVAGLGSTVTDAAWLLSGRPLASYKSKEVNGQRVSRADLERLRGELLENAQPVESGRSAISHDLRDPLGHQLGLATLVAVMNALGAPIITACGTGLRFGLAYAFLHGIPLAMAGSQRMASDDPPGPAAIDEDLKPGHGSTGPGRG
jgi:exopolyphosphatase / guanosine-5'-triphosphate,3'-diphosphate pyrophosphatase